MVRNLIRKKHLIWVNLRDPRRAWNSFLSLVSFRFKTLRPWGQPIVVDMEPANFCNLKCQHCQVTHWKKRKNCLTMDHFTSWVKSFRTASRIKLQGMGEPFLNKDLPAIIKELEKDRVCIEVVSNGTVMTDEIYDVMTRTRDFTITFSVDGADKEAFERIRVGGNFDEIKANLTRIVRAPRRSKVSAWMVGFQERRDQIKPTLEMLARLGVDEFYLQLVVINFGQATLDEKTVDRRIRTETETRAFKADLYATARQKGLHLEIADNLYDERHPCPWPWLGTYIDTEGNVIPCCRVANADICNFGNLNREDFRTIWESEAYRRFREQIRNHTVPAFCRSCYHPSEDETGGMRFSDK